MIKKISKNYTDRTVLNVDGKKFLKFKFKDFNFFKNNLRLMEFYDFEKGSARIVKLTGSSLFDRNISEKELFYYFNQIFVFYIKKLEFFEFNMSLVLRNLFKSDTLDMKLPFLILFKNRYFINYSTICYNPLFFREQYYKVIQDRTKYKELDDILEQHIKKTEGKFFDEKTDKGYNNVLFPSIKIEMPLPNYLERLDLIFVVEFKSREEFFEQLIEINDIELIYTTNKYDKKI